jgi:RsiW-degrading membrane proteinase PrsW (M82 family)
MGSYQLVMFITYINALVIYAIAPVLIFAVFYFIGKKPELKLELRPILLTLLIGFLASFFVGSIIYSAMVMEMTVDYILAIMLHFIMTFFAADLFATLAGLSIGHNRQKKLTSITEQELS